MMENGSKSPIKTARNELVFKNSIDSKAIKYQPRVVGGDEYDDDIIMTKITNMRMTSS